MTDDTPTKATERRPAWRAWGAAAALSAIPAAAALCLIDSCTFPWCDELCLCDGMYMKALRGIEWSAVSACAYNPLYPMLLYVWAKLFGASHFAASALSVSIGYVACVVIAAIARRRGWWASIWGDAAFVFLFWGGWVFSTELTTARPDVLALLLGALFADALATEENGAHPLLRVFAAAVALFLAAPYPLPLMFFFGLFLVATAGSSQARMAILGRGFAAMAGFILGMAVTMAYYALQHDLMRLLGSYIYFNSITGHAPTPFGIRLLSGYAYDATAIALCAIAMATGAIRGRTRPVALFVAAIPFMMTLGGRYQPYYLWTFYVPCSILAVYTVSRIGRKSVAALAAVGLAMCAARHVASYRSEEPARAFRDACRRFVDANSRRLGGGVDVIVAENVEGRADFYYPLMRHGARVWFRGENALSGRSDEEKFVEGISLLPCSDERRRDIMKFIARIQRFVPLLPEKALVLFYSEDDVKKVKPLFEAKGCVLSPLEKDGDFSLWEMRRSAEAG